MADQKQPGQPQAGQPQPAAAPAKRSKAQEYDEQLKAAQAKYLERYQTAWANYYQKVEQATTEHNSAVREIHEAARKAAAPQSTGDSTPAQSIEAFRAARSKSLHSVNEVHVQLRNAEHKYGQKLTSFWDDVWDSVSDAVQDFWDWIVGWWEDPPVEGVAPVLRTLADPAWRASFDPAAIAYYGGWNYGPKLV